MGITKKLDIFTTCINRRIRSMLVMHSEKQNIRKKKSLIDKVKLTEEQIKEVDSYFMKYYGHKIPYDWHRLYQSYTGVFCENYFPEILFSTLLEPYTNPYHIAEFLDDKNLLPVLFRGIDGLHIPTTYVSSVKGRLQDGQGGMLSENQAFSLLSNIGLCVIKKTIETSSGRDVQLCNLKNGIDLKTGKALSEVLRCFGKDYVVQEMIHQNPSLAALCGSSVNTFRVMTYICNEQINVCPIALRLGRAGAEKDNIHYGGITVGVNTKNMTLKPVAFSEYGEKYYTHPDSHVKFDGYKLGGVKNIMSIAIKLHERIPYMGILSWDLTIDEEGQVVIIEMNSTGQSAWFPQFVNGESLFGENTPQILKLIKNK